MRIVGFAQEIESAQRPDQWVQDIIMSLKQRLESADRKKEWLAVKEIRGEIKVYYGFDEDTEDEILKREGMKPPHQNFITDKLKTFLFPVKKLPGERTNRYHVELDYLKELQSRYGIED